MGPTFAMFDFSSGFVVIWYIIYSVFFLQFISSAAAMWLFLRLLRRSSGSLSSKDAQDGMDLQFGDLKSTPGNPFQYAGSHGSLTVSSRVLKLQTVLI